MLHLILPASLHRSGLRIAHAVRLRWWRIRKPLLIGCRVLAFDADGHLLLIRHAYGSGRWMLPGGGVGRRETPLDAALRELREEVGGTLRGATQVGMIEEPLSGTTNRVFLIAGQLEGAVKIDQREVIAAEWFAPDALPGDMAAVLVRNLPDWIIAAKAAHPDR